MKGNWKAYAPLLWRVLFGLFFLLTLRHKEVAELDNLGPSISHAQDNVILPELASHISLYPNLHCVFQPLLVKALL